MRLVDRAEWRIMDVPPLLQHTVRIAPVSLHPPTMLASKVGIIVHSVRSAICGQLPLLQARNGAARHLLCGAPSDAASSRVPSICDVCEAVSTDASMNA